MLLKNIFSGVFILSIYFSVICLWSCWFIWRRHTFGGYLSILHISCNDCWYMRYDVTIHQYHVDGLLKYSYGTCCSTVTGDIFLWAYCSWWGRENPAWKGLQGGTVSAQRKHGYCWQLCFVYLSQWQVS